MITRFMLASVAVLAATQAAAATYTVDRLDDVATASACTSQATDCSLRGAIIRANKHPGADVVVVPAGLYNLNLVGAGEDAAETATSTSRAT